MLPMKLDDVIPWFDDSKQNLQFRHLEELAAKKLISFRAKEACSLVVKGDIMRVLPRVCQSSLEEAYGRALQQPRPEFSYFFLTMVVCRKRFAAAEAQASQGYEVEGL